jgi:RHH-type proline utilization regulon transcriptional repressor/proline dehydrogenase/delta 1-pyrroline-5-carboxylate dehydrogenase
LTTLEPGETWLVQPRIDPQNPRLCSPGIKLAVKAGSPSHQTEYFCPLLCVARASDLEHALRIANGTKYGLTSGIHSLDEREQQQWIDGIDAGNIYVNRRITGAIVQRQPFGGFKASSFGPTAKAGGPNTLRQFFRIRNRTALRVATPGEPSERRSYDALALRRLEQLHAPLYALIRQQPQADAWLRQGLHYLDAYFEHYATPSDPSAVLGEHNHLRTLPLKRVLVLAGPNTTKRDLLFALLAAAVCETPVQTLLPEGPEWAAVCSALGAGSYGNDVQLGLLLGQSQATRVRNLGAPLTPEPLRVVHQRGMTCVNEPVSQSGLVELLYYLKEQAVSVSYHRYGNLGPRVT